MRKFCRECNTVMPGQARFCPACGHRWRRVTDRHLAEIAELLAPMPSCVMCQAAVPARAMFCPRCGLVTPVLLRRLGK
jgi:rRNA maturation endonuclease Nob1